LIEFKLENKQRRIPLWYRQAVLL